MEIFQSNASLSFSFSLSPIFHTNKSFWQKSKLKKKENLE